MKKYKITDKLELIPVKDFIILKPKHKPRSSWEKAFKKMHENGDDKMLIEDVFEGGNLEDWKLGIGN